MSRQRSTLPAAYWGRDVSDAVSPSCGPIVNWRSPSGRSSRNALRKCGLSSKQVPQSLKIWQWKHYGSGREPARAGKTGRIALTRPATDVDLSAGSGGRMKGDSLRGVGFDPSQP